MVFGIKYKIGILIQYNIVLYINPCISRAVKYHTSSHDSTFVEQLQFVILT